MRKLDFYELVGVVAPGMVLLVSLKFVLPAHIFELQIPDISIGGFGISLIIAYVTGHLLQAVGNIIEMMWWFICGGWPSDWLRTDTESKLLSKEQKAQLENIIKNRFKMPSFALNREMSSAAWYSVFRRIYAEVRAAGRDDRIYIFNGNYGLFRGITVAILIACPLVLIFRGFEDWPIAAVLFLAAGLATFRMHHFAVHYARETFIQFINLPNEVA